MPRIFLSHQSSKQTKKQQYFHRGVVKNKSAADSKKFSLPSFYLQIGKIVCLLFTIYVSWLLISTQFVVKKVTCLIYPGQWACPTALNEQCQQLLGKRLLFYNFANIISSWKNQQLPFISSNYQKIFPHHLLVTFTFHPPAYVLLAHGQSYGFDAWGDYTPIPTSDNPLMIEINNEQVASGLIHRYLDPVLADKFYALTYLLAKQQTSVTKAVLTNLQNITLQTSKGNYLLDLFALDENLQKLAFLEHSDYNFNQKETLIDLRLNLPVIKNN